MSLTRRRGRDRGALGQAEELAVYRQFVAQLTAACEDIARGDLEARARPVPGSDVLPALVGLQDAVNRVLDVSDAFVRESSAASTSAAEGKFHRQVLTTGLPGAFRVGAAAINASGDAMKAAAGRVGEAQTSRLALADEFESVVMAVSEQVATASTQLSASATGLTAAMRA